MPKKEPALPPFARRLRDLRGAAGLTAYRLAQKAELSRQFLSSLEAGDKEPSWATVQKLADALGVEVERFRE